MKRTLIILFNHYAFGVIIGIVLLISGCSNSLSRGQATNIINEKRGSLLGKPLDIYIPTYISLAYVKLNDDEVNKRVPLDLSPLPKGKYLEAKFADILEKSGLLTLVSAKNTTATYYKGFVGPVNYDMAVHQYTCAMNPDINIIDQFKPDKEKVVIILARPELNSITGIAQTDATAQVEAEAIMKPTEMYSKLKECAEKLRQREGSAQISGDDEEWWDSLWRQLSNIDGQINSVSKITLSFTKYDDGWRINERP